MLEIRVPKSCHHPQISCGCHEVSDPALGSSSHIFSQQWNGAVPRCIQEELAGITARVGVLQVLLSHALLSSGCLWQWGAPAGFSGSNPTIQGRLFHGCDYALRVPFESLISELRDLHRVTSLEWLQWL